MKKRIFLYSIIAVCIILSVCVCKYFSQTSAPKQTILGEKIAFANDNATVRDSANNKTLVSVEIYSKSNPKHIITLKPNLDSTLTSQYSKLLEGQSPAKGEDGSDYEVVASFSDGSKSYYGIDAQQTELAALCDNTLGLTFASPL